MSSDRSEIPADSKLLISRINYSLYYYYRYLFYAVQVHRLGYKPPVATDSC